MIRLCIQELAIERGFTQKRLREAARVTAPQLSKLWHNHAQRVELEALEKIAKALGTKPGDLIVSDEVG